MKIKSFRAWIIVGVLTLTGCIGFGFAYNSASLYIGPVCEDFGIGRTEYGFITSAATISGFLVAFFQGKMLIALKKVKRLLLIGVASGICYLALFYLASNIYILYFAGILRGVFTSSCSLGCMSVLVIKWFDEKKATAIGITASGMGLGGIIVAPLVSYMISAYGWRQASLMSACIMAVILLPAVLLLPEEPKNSEAEAEAVNAAVTPSEETDKFAADGMGADFIVKTPLFWMSVCGSILLSTAIASILTNVADILGKTNLNPSSIPIVISTLFLASTIAKAATGLFLDKFGVRATITLGMIFFCASVVCVLNVGSIAIAFAFAIFYGIGHSMAFMPITIMVDQLFGPKNYGTLIGYFFAAMEIGFAVSPILNGLSVDLTGSYHPALYIAMVIAALCLLMITAAIKMSEKQKSPKAAL